MTDLMTELVQSSRLAFSGGMKKFLQEDVQHSLQMRLFKTARTGWDPTVQSMLKAMGSGAHELVAFRRAVGRVDEIYFTIMRKDPLSKRGVARLEAAMETYKDARKELMKVKNDDLKILVTWNDRDFAERVRCIDVRMRRPPSKKLATGLAGPPPLSKPAVMLAQKQKKAAADLREHRAKLLYFGYVDSMSVVSKAQRNSMWRFNDYLPHDDPVWVRLVDLMNHSAQ